jgi:ATP-dependent Clp protease ATP-binding subunit ClpC
MWPIGPMSQLPYSAKLGQRLPPMRIVRRAPMVTSRVESELASIERQAEQLARGRKERVTSAHLLAAMAGLSGGAASLLRDRRLGAEDLLRAARAATDDEKDPIRPALAGARNVAERMRAPEPLALHLMISLLGDRRTAAHRALDQCGVDVRRLRLAAMNQALGLLGRRPILSRKEGELAPGLKQVQAGTPRTTSAPRPGRPTPPRRRAQLVSPEDLRDRRRGKPMPVSAPPESVDAMPTPPSPRKTHTAHALSDAEQRFALSRKQFPLLSRFGTNLTLAAARGELDGVVCREAEIDRVLDVLSKRFANNPCLVGPSGVGKTRIVHGVALRMAALATPASEQAQVLIELGAAALLTGTGVRGGLAQRMQALRDELEQGGGRIVIFFDEVHQLFTGDGGEELAAEFKLAISRGQLPCIGATTREEYARSIEADPALCRRFSVVEIEEPSREEAFLVLSALAPKFETHHGVKYAEEALALAIAWSVQYVPGKALPDKAISVLDLSGARARRRGKCEVLPEQVAEVISEICGVPVERLLQNDGERLLGLEQCLASRVVGHTDCLRAIATAVRRNAAGLGGKRPIGTFLLLGPTGVGKTETAKALAEALFFSDQAMLRLDLSEYSEAHAVARLIGAPPGYVGHEAGGQLTEAVRRRPYQVILLDELEKAHPDVLESFLALFDEGRMTDGRGRTIDFTHTLIVMTSNLGVSDTTPARQLGFQRAEQSDGTGYRERMLRRVREALAPELFNRIDEVLVFEPLDRDQVCEIAERLLGKLAGRLREGREVQVVFEPTAIDVLLAAGGVDLTLGARPMQRTISRLVEGPLADMILRGQVAAGSSVIVRGHAGEIIIERRAAPRAAE